MKIYNNFLSAIKIQYYNLKKTESLYKLLTFLCRLYDIKNIILFCWFSR